MGLFFFDDRKNRDFARSCFPARSRKISNIWDPTFVALEILNQVKKNGENRSIIKDARAILVFFKMAAIVRPSSIGIFPQSIKNWVCGTNIKEVMGIFGFFDNRKIHDPTRSRFLARSRKILKIWGPTFVALEIMDHIKKTERIGALLRTLEQF